MNENLKMVKEKLFADSEFANKMTRSKSAEEAYELAKTVADGYTPEEFQDMMRDLYRISNGSKTEHVSPTEGAAEPPFRQGSAAARISLENAAHEVDVEEELTEEDLMSVAGGRMFEDPTTRKIAATVGAAGV